MDSMQYWSMILSEILLGTTLVCTAPKQNIQMFVPANVIALVLLGDSLHRLRILEEESADEELRKDMILTLKEQQAYEQLQSHEDTAKTKKAAEAADSSMLRQLKTLESTAPILSQIFSLTGTNPIGRMGLGMIQNGTPLGEVLIATSEAEMQLEQAKIVAQLQQRTIEAQSQPQASLVATLPTHTINAAVVEASNDNIDKIKSAAKVVGITTECIKKDVAPSYQRLIFSVKTEDFALLPKWDKASALSLGQEAPSYVCGSEQVAWEVNLENGDRTFKSFPDDRQWKKYGRVLLLGWGIDGEITIDLASDDTPQLLIVGTTGAGKSVLIRSLIYCLLKQQCRVSVCGGKTSDFEDFGERYPDEVVVQDMGKTLEYVGEFYIECDRRNSLSKTELNQQQPWVLVIDEFKGSLPLDPVLKKIYDTQLNEVARRGRGLKLHLIIGLQRGSLRSKDDPQGLPADLRSNLPCRVALRVSEAKDGRMVLHRRGNAAVNLCGKGDAIVQSGLIDTRFQAYNFEVIP